MKSDQSHCLGGLHYSLAKIQNVFEKVNPQSHKVDKFIKRKYSICGRNKSTNFTK